MNNFIEIYTDDVILDFEKQMLAEVNIPSLLPVNIINQNGRDSICFITTGYRTIAETEIPDIETLCHMIKSLVGAIITSEQYLLMGGKHFVDADVTFYDPVTKEIKLVFGKVCDRDNHYGDTDVIIEFIENIKNIITDKVHLQILKQIKMEIKLRNPDIKRIRVLVEEIERKWYCRNLIPDFPFSKKKSETENVKN